MYIECVALRWAHCISRQDARRVRCTAPIRTNQEACVYPINTVVWNMKSQTERLVQLTPSSTWGGAGLLGVTIRLDNYADAHTRMIRCLEVEQPNSPAALAGLVPFQDYLLGTTVQTLDSVETLAALLQAAADTVVELYVYNAVSDMVRVVALVPTLQRESSSSNGNGNSSNGKNRNGKNSSGSGSGLLGAQVGTGYLHRLPAAVQNTSGASVQRKVRHMACHTDKSNNKSDTPSKSKTPTTTVARSPNDPSKGTTLVEVEPQLEMEICNDDDSDDDDDDDDEEVEPVAKPARQKTLAVPSPVHNVAIGNRLEAVSLEEEEAPTMTSTPTTPLAQRFNDIKYQQQQQQLQQAYPPPPAPPTFSYSSCSSNDDIATAATATANNERIQLSYSAYSTDGESSIASDSPVKMTRPVQMKPVHVQSSPSSRPGAFSSVAAIFSRPPPKGSPDQAPTESSAPAGYTTSGGTDRFLPPPPKMRFAAQHW